MRKRKSFLNDDSRLEMVRICFFIAFFVIIAKLFSIQILNHEKYSAMAQDQYTDLYEIPAKRGDILSRDGYILAGTQINYLMYAEPKVISNKHKTAHELAELISGFEVEKALESQDYDSVDQSTQSIDIIRDSQTDNNIVGIEGSDAFIPDDVEISETDPVASEKPEKSKIFAEKYDKYLGLMNFDLLWIALEKGITPEQKELIEQKNFEGVGFEEEPARYYPEGNLAAHVLGFVAHNEAGEKIGYYGVEGYMNDDLKGKAGRVIEERDATGKPILTGGYKKIEPIQGRSLILTIDKTIQYIVEKKLKEGVQMYDAVSGSVIVMNPSTGEVIAMANYPFYDPGNIIFEDIFLESSPHRKKYERVNLAISQTYEPGSVMKSLTISSAVDLNIVTPETSFVDGGPVWYSGHEIDNWDGKHHGTQTIVQLLQKSNNIGAAWVGTLVGSKNMYKYMGEFGIGKKTGIELEGEDTGILRDYKTWTDIDLATAAFGQGVSATPLQVLNVFNTIANGGYLLQPQIIHKISDGSKEIDIPAKNLGRVISGDTSETMIDLLEKAASGGEAQYFVLKNYRIAGKTGTAQIPVGGKYDPNKTNATFAGFLAGTKQFSMIVKLEEPKAKIYASETSVPLWMDITTELVKYYGIAPDKEPAEETAAR